MYEIGNDTECDLGKLCAPSHEGHACRTGVGGPPPPALPQIRYVWSLEIVEREESGHGDVCQMSRAETQAYDKEGGAGKHNGDLPVLWYTSGFGEKN